MQEKSEDQVPPRSPLEVPTPELRGLQNIVDADVQSRYLRQLDAARRYRGPLRPLPRRTLRDRIRGARAWLADRIDPWD